MSNVSRDGDPSALTHFFHQAVGKGAYKLASRGAILEAFHCTRNARACCLSSSVLARCCRPGAVAGSRELAHDGRAQQGLALP